MSRSFAGQAWSDLIADLFPFDVFAEAMDLADPPELLLEAEAAIIGRASPRRRADFAAGRDCARRALRRAGYRDAPLLRGANGAPQWPCGVVGSLTHGAGLCCAVVARARDARAVGIDVESAVGLDADLRRLVCTPSELAHHRSLDASFGDWPKLTFSAKEAVYKCLSPILRRFVDFGEVMIEFGADEGPHRGSFKVRAADISTPIANLCGEMVGRWRQEGGLVIAAASVGVR